MNDNKDARRYDDIIGLPHHVSEKHPRMAAIQRAAQFAPFAALTGYEAAIEETARLTMERIELDEDSKAVLDIKLQVLMERIREHPEVTITCFRSDQKKDGGTYITITGNVKKLDNYNRVLVMTDGTVISLDDILEIEGELFLHI